MLLGTIEMVNMVPNGFCSILIGHHRNGLYGAQWCSLNAIGHHRNGLYGAQWFLFNPHWAP